MIVNNNHNNGARETNKTKNRQAIIEAGIRVFISKGVSETTVRDIIRSTGLASGTFYNYFNSKEEVLVAIFNDFAKEIGKTVRDENVQPNNFEEFMNYIEEKYNCISLLSNITEMKKISKTINQTKQNNKDIIDTTRMSIIHTI